jgi:predicted metal-dependent hydrolase
LSPAAPQQLSLWPEDEDAVSSPALGSPVDGVARSRAEHGGLQAAVCTLPCFRHPRADREIHFSKAIVAYEFKRVSRRSIGMVVGVEGLSVRAPRWVAIRDVEMALRAKERWICGKLVEQQERGQRQAQAQIEWRDGAPLPYLGDTLNMRCETLTFKGSVRRDAGSNTLTVNLRRDVRTAPDSVQVQERMRDQVHAWLQDEARRVFVERVALYAPVLGVSVSRISLSSARTRWGSASASGAIRLHWRLIHFGLDIIDYVVVHELAHLREMNHSPRFWAVVRSALPDYEEARQRLKHLSAPA